MDAYDDRIWKSSRDRKFSMHMAAFAADIQHVREAKTIRGLFP